MIIQLKNQAEKNVILAGMRYVYEQTELPHHGVYISIDALNAMLSHGTDETLTPDEIHDLAIRINSDMIICDGCEAEFTSPFDSILCPDCSKNQESRNA